MDAGLFIAREVFLHTDQPHMQVLLIFHLSPAHIGKAHGSAR